MEAQKYSLVDASQKYIKFVNAASMDENTIDDADISISPIRELTYDDIEQPNDQNVQNEQSNSNCGACAIGNFPSEDAHKCVVCSAPVHLLKGCSVSCGDEEGYGERRICISCNLKKSKNLSVNLNETVEWDRKGKRSKTSYLKPLANWKIIPKTTKKLEISILQDASMSNTTHKIGGQLCHLLALAYSYHPKGQNFDAFYQAVFVIAVKLAKR